MTDLDDLLVRLRDLLQHARDQDVADVLQAAIVDAQARVQVPAPVVSFGPGTQIADVSIGDVAGRNIITYHTLLQAFSQAAELPDPSEAQLWLRDLTFDGWAAYNGQFRARDRVSLALLSQKRNELLALHGGDNAARPFERPQHWAAFTLIGA
jgi:hypothetical protein